nr:MAG TPA: hypothetical protein [Bacteriophage sp.]
MYSIILDFSFFRSFFYRIIYYSIYIYDRMM